MATNQMSSPSRSSEADEFVSYKALSKAAVIAAALTLLSLSALIPELWLLLVLPVGGIICGFVALKNIRLYPEELTGRKLAKISIVGSSVFFVAGLCSNIVDYYTEVPEGFERVSFYQLQPDSMNPEQLVSPRALELNGKKVFLKGYPHSGISGSGPVKDFLLVPDMKACCFGGQPKLIDMIEVNLVGDRRIRWMPRKFELAGTLIVDARPKPNDGSAGGYFRLEAEYVK